MEVWTVGHSTRSAEAFLALLRAHRIETIADVRRFPTSRRHPQFNSATLAAILEDALIGYVPMPDLGGRRPAKKDSRNTVWREASFRGYADYMETPTFDTALAKLIDAASVRRTAVMCAEAVWWQCHRQMIADALKARGHRVLHIMDAVKVTEHPFTSAARVIDGHLQYGAAGLDQFWDAEP